MLVMLLGVANFQLSIFNFQLGIAIAQSYISGTIVDKEMGDPMPGVRISYVEYPNTRAVSDLNGHYRILARKGTLTFNVIGYETNAVSIDKIRTQRINIKLIAGDNAMKEVVITEKRGKYSRKDNPAVDFMRRVIEAKDSSDIRRHDYLSYQKYEKMILSLNEFTEKVFEDDHFKRLPFLKEHVEVCPETGKLILPLTVDEQVSQQIYRRDPKTEKTIIFGKRSEGITDLINTGDIVNNLMADCFTDVDIYKDDVRLLQYPFISPISSKNGISFYRFYLSDTLYIDQKECIQVDFTPNNPQDFGFSGSLYVLADSSYQIRKAHLTIPSRSDVNFVEQMDIIQDFQPLPSGERVVVDNKMIVQLKVASFLQKLQVERTVRYKDFDFTQIPERSFKIRGDVKEESSAQMRDEEFWEGYRPAPLSQSESQMGVLLKRLQELKGMKYIIWVAKAFIENFVETSINPQHPSKVDIGPVNTMIGSNWVEGFRLRASAQTTANLNPHWFLKGYVKYGFGDKRWKGMGELTYSFNKKDYLPREYPVRNISYTYTNDVMSPSDKFVPTDKDNVFIAWKWTPVRHMQYFERHNLLLDWEWENGMRLNAQLRREWNEGAGALFYQTLDNGIECEGYQVDGNDVLCMPDAEGQMKHRITFAEATVSLNYQPGATYVNTKQRRVATNHDAPILGLSHTVGVKGILGSEYNYNFTEATVYKRFWLHSWGKLDCMFKGGVQWNKVPYPFLIMPAANLSYIMENNTFNLINNMEFLNDRYASAMISWDMNGKLLNRIPLIKKLKWREFVGVNMLWGTLSDKNNPFLARNAADPMLMYFSGQYKNGQFQYISHVMNRRRPYFELVVGLHNIFKLVHLEYVHRMNYIYPGTQRWGLRTTFRVTF